MMDSAVLLSDAEVEASGVRLDERAELVKLAVRLLQEGVSRDEILDSLDTYISRKRWRQRGINARYGIMDSAQAILQKAAAEEAAKKAELAAQQANEPGELQIVSLTEMEPQAVRWLWPGRIPLGKVTVICGAAQGKTCLALDLVARVSVGAEWPEEASGGVSEPGQVLLLNGEDHCKDTILPRLAGGGANLTNITAISGMKSGAKADSTGERSFDLERDLPVLKQRIETLGGVRLVVIDSLASLCGSAGARSGARLRKVVAALGKLADECGVAVVVISSGNKCDLPVKHVWHVDCDVLDPELRLWVPVKFTCGRCPSGLAYRITDTGIEWDPQPLSLTANRMRGATAKQERNWRSIAIAEWLKTYLGSGPRPAKEVLEAGTAAGWSADQVKRAKLALEIVCRKEPGKNGRWIWQLATPGGQPASQVPGPNLSAPAVAEAASQTDPALEWLERARRLDPNRLPKPTVPPVLLGGPITNSVQQNKESKERTGRVTSEGRRVKANEAGLLDPSAADWGEQAWKILAGRVKGEM